MFPPFWMFMKEVRVLLLRSYEKDFRRIKEFGSVSGQIDFKLFPKKN